MILHSPTDQSHQRLTARGSLLGEGFYTSKAMANDTRAYVAIGSCGHVVAACSADSSPKELADSLSRWAKRGASVERMTSEELKAAWCRCVKKARQKSLLD